MWKTLLEKSPIMALVFSLIVFALMAGGSYLSKFTWGGNALNQVLQYILIGSLALTLLSAILVGIKWWIYGLTRADLWMAGLPTVYVVGLLLFWPVSNFLLKR